MDTAGELPPDPVTTSPGPRRRTRFRVRMAVVLCSLLLALVAAEIAARILFPVVHLTRHFEPGMFLPDPERGWVPKPGYEGTYMEFLSEVKVRVNRLGLRGPEQSPAEDCQASLRVLCVGDSNTFGLGVGDTEAYPARIEAAVRAGGRSCAVWNAGVVGYATDQERITMEKYAPALDPRVVVLGWLRNDVGKPRFRPRVIDGYVARNREAYEKFRRDVTEHRFYEVSRLVTVLDLALKLHRHRRRIAGRAERAAGERDDPAEMDRNVALVAEMARITRRRGARFLVLAFDGQAQVRTGTEHPVVTEFIGRMKDEGIETIPVGRILHADYAARGERLFVPRDDIHLNARGHRLVAEAVTALLR